MPVRGGYLALAGAGGLLVWSGLKGKSWSQVLRTVLNGRKPETTATTLAITAPDITGGGVPASGANVGPLAQSIASDAQQYVGAGYVWGGAPAKGIGNWDCSSFCNWVIGHDMRRAIPLYAPGTYSGNSHGPPTTVWLVWSGCFTIKRQDALPGDLAVWQTHMGIITGNNRMVSALNSTIGTRQTSIDGAAPPGEILAVRRLKAVTSG